MQGYRVWFNGEKFVSDENTTEVQYNQGYHDIATSWFADKASANKAVAKWNRDNLDDIKSCKECGAYFWQKEVERQWYKEHGMNPPRRCYLCRKKRKSENK